MLRIPESSSRNLVSVRKSGHENSSFSLCSPSFLLTVYTPPPVGYQETKHPTCLRRNIERGFSVARSGLNLLSQIMKSLRCKTIQSAASETENCKPCASFTQIKLFSSPSLLASPLLHLCILSCLVFGCLIQRASIWNQAQHLLFCNIVPLPHFSPALSFLI